MTQTPHFAKLPTQKKHYNNSNNINYIVKNTHTTHRNHHIIQTCTSETGEETKRVSGIDCHFQNYLQTRTHNDQQNGMFVGGCRQTIETIQLPYRSSTG